MKPNNNQSLAPQKNRISKVQTQAAVKPKSVVEKEEITDEAFALGKTNIKLIGISFIVIILGFLLMLGGGSTEDTYNPDIFSFRRLILGPGIAFVGFVFMVYAIMYKEKGSSKNKD